MDNEDKIKSTRTDISIFLDEHLERRVGPPDLYNLQDEFSKTKKNREILFKLILFLFLSLIFFGTFIIISFIQNKNKNISIDIGDFHEVDLKEILNTARKYENELTLAKKGLDGILTEKQVKINEVNVETQKNLEDIRLLDIPEEEMSVRTSSILKIGNYKLSQIELQYENTLKDQNKKIEEIQNKMAQYDQRQIEIAKKNEEVVSNQQKLFEMEMKKMIQFYEDKLDESAVNYKNLKNYYLELVNRINKNKDKEIKRLISKYNPIYQDEEFLYLTKIKPIDDTSDVYVTDSHKNSDPFSDVTVDAPKYIFPFFNDYVDQFGNEKILTQSEFKRIRRYIDSREKLVGRLRKEPYINSIPICLESIENYDKNILNKYETIIKKFIDVVDNKNETISELNNDKANLLLDIDKLNSHIKAQDDKIAEKNNIIKEKEKDIIKHKMYLENLLDGKYQGLILEVTDKKNIVLHIKAVEGSLNGKIADVVNLKNEKIGKIKLREKNGQITGEEFILNYKKSYSPLDRLIIQN